MLTSIPHKTASKSVYSPSIYSTGARVIVTGGLLAGTLICLAPSASHAALPDVMSESDFIAGSMEIDFGTRRNLDTSGKFVEGSPAENSKDVYTLNLNVAKTTEYSGKIERKPLLISKMLGREVQSAQLVYDIGLAVRNPKDLTQKKSVGKWVGTVAIGKDGVYDFGSGDPTSSQLRMAVDAIGKAAAFVGPFSGKIYGKSEKTKGEIADKLFEYSRMIKGKQVKVTAKKVDPLRFVNLTLGEGPAQIYPRSVVNGNLDYDYETGNWYTNGIRFKYTLDGVEYEDVVTGSIKWVEDANRATNGKGSYEFNLRFNEEKLKPAADEGAAFEGGSDATGEEAFFAVDNSIPSMTGTIAFQDTLGGGGDEPSVIASKVTYKLDANKLTKQQAVNLFKLWLVIVGPTNDE